MPHFTYHAKKNQPENIQEKMMWYGNEVIIQLVYALDTILDTWWTWLLNAIINQHAIIKQLTLTIKFPNDSIEESILWCHVTPSNRHLCSIPLKFLDFLSPMRTSKSTSPEKTDDNHCALRHRIINTVLLDRSMSMTSWDGPSGQSSQRKERYRKCATT
jgi:hypothetical protein